MNKLALLVFSLVLLSCSEKSSKTEILDQNLTLSNTEIIEFHLATAIPIEGGFSILEQAEHYAVSEIQHRENGIFYVYKPEEGFTGTDQVKIKREDSNGAEVYSETITVLNIEVTD